jgi:ribosomal protein S18 acetylase RimI-like enzyme
MAFTLHEMTIDDHAEVLALWQRSPGLHVNPSDEREPIERYLVRNPGLSVVARQDGRLVGTLLCGHDGRRAYLYHLAVCDSARRQGVGRAMVERCLERLRAIDIVRVFLMVLNDNTGGDAFWRALGWKRADDCGFYFRSTDP